MLCIYGFRYVENVQLFRYLDLNTSDYFVLMRVEGRDLCVMRVEGFMCDEGGGKGRGLCVMWVEGRAYV